MKKLVGLVLLLCSITTYAQSPDYNGTSHVTLRNGARVCAKYNAKTEILNVEIQDNEDEVEVLAVENGKVVDFEMTIFDDDNIKLDFSNKGNQQLDIYVRTRKELQYMGTVETKK